MGSEPVPLSKMAFVNVPCTCLLLLKYVLKSLGMLLGLKIQNEVVRPVVHSAQEGIHGMLRSNMADALFITFPSNCPSMVLWVNHLRFLCTIFKTFCSFLFSVNCSQHVYSLNN